MRHADLWACSLCQTFEAFQPNKAAIHTRQKYNFKHLEADYLPSRKDMAFTVCKFKVKVRQHMLPLIFNTVTLTVYRVAIN
jgi:hypothetical protein